MGQMRFNHMELTFPPGTLTDEFRADLGRFYGGVLGWTTKTVPILGQQGELLQPDPGQFVLCIEHPEPMNRPRYDHLGLLMDTRAEVDEVLDAVEAFAEGDDRLEIKRYDDLVMPQVTVHAFYFRYLLPIHFDVQCQERAPGQGPTHDWRWVPVS